MTERSELVRALRDMPYALYLRTEHWQAVRAAARRRAAFRCERCGSIDQLQVHHRTYARLGRERSDDVEVLCVDCHERAHGIGEEPAT